MNREIYSQLERNNWAGAYIKIESKIEKGKIQIELTVHKLQTSSSLEIYGDELVEWIEKFKRFYST